MPRRLLFLGRVLVLLSGVVSLGVRPTVWAQDVVVTPFPFPDIDGPDFEKQKLGESVLTGATAELLAAGLLPAAFALQRVTIAPGGHTVTPGGDPRVVLLYAETAFTMRAGDSVLSPAGSGSELRNDGSEGEWQ
ncbi:MAG: hypothetical protein M3464_18020 [Chloroflexota bacterium]|nr:hypothetical protein [Chloroflexota bacterium]